MTKEQIQAINDKYDLYRTTPEGIRLSLILDTLARQFSAWVSGEHDAEHSWFFQKKKILVQFLDVMGDYDDYDSEPYCTIE